MSNKIEHIRDGLPSSNCILDMLEVQQLAQMFNLLPDILFWIKNKKSEIVYANSYFIQHIGRQNLADVEGLNDYDFAPRHIAKQFILDDKLVMQGQVVIDRLEMNVLKSGELCWFTTSKKPLYDCNETLIGSYGISRHLDKTSLALSGMEALKTPVEFVRKYYMDDICLDDLAKASHLSISALERRFKKYLSKTPKQYINEVRLENARRLLAETNMPIAVVANEVGFSDHSYFSRLFRLQFDELPSCFRENCR